MDEDDFRKEFEFLSFLNKSYENELYLENVKHQVIESKSFDIKEYKKQILSIAYNMNGLFCGCSSLKYF